MSTPMTEAEHLTPSGPTLFAVPLGDPLAETERTIAGHLTRILAWTGLAVALIATPTVLLVAPEQWTRLAVSLVAGAVGATGLCLLRRNSIGRVRSHRCALHGPGGA